MIHWTSVRSGARPFHAARSRWTIALESTSRFNRPRTVTTDRRRPYYRPALAHRNKPTIRLRSPDHSLFSWSLGPRNSSGAGGLGRKMLCHRWFERDHFKLLHRRSQLVASLLGIRWFKWGAARPPHPKDSMKSIFSMTLSHHKVSHLLPAWPSEVRLSTRNQSSSLVGIMSPDRRL